MDPRFMLGNERNLYEVDWVRYCHATQVGKIEGVWEGFGKHCEQVRKLDRPCVNCDFVSAAGRAGSVPYWGPLPSSTMPVHAAQTPASDICGGPVPERIGLRQGALYPTRLLCLQVGPVPHRSPSPQVHYRPGLEALLYRTSVRRQPPFRGQLTTAESLSPPFRPRLTVLHHPLPPGPGCT